MYESHEFWINLVLTFEKFHLIELQKKRKNYVSL